MMPGPDPDPDRDLCALCGFPLPEGWPHGDCPTCRRDQYSDERHEVEPEDEDDE